MTNFQLDAIETIAGIMRLWWTDGPEDTVALLKGVKRKEGIISRRVELLRIAMTEFVHMTYWVNPQWPEHIRAILGVRPVVIPMFRVMYPEFFKKSCLSRRSITSSDIRGYVYFCIEADFAGRERAQEIQAEINAFIEDLSVLPINDLVPETIREFLDTEVPVEHPAYRLLVAINEAKARSDAFGIAAVRLADAVLG